MVIDRLDAQVLNRLFTGDNFLGVRDAHQLHVPGIGRGQFRVHRTLPGIDKIARHDRVAVRPLGVVAQGEGVDVVGVVRLEPRRDARHQIAVGILVHQAFEQVSHDFRA